MRRRRRGRIRMAVSKVGFDAWVRGDGRGEQEYKDSADALHRVIDPGNSLSDTAAGDDLVVRLPRHAWLGGWHGGT